MLLLRCEKMNQVPSSLCELGWAMRKGWVRCVYVSMFLHFTLMLFYCKQMLMVRHLDIHLWFIIVLLVHLFYYLSKIDAKLVFLNLSTILQLNNFKAFLTCMLGGRLVKIYAYIWVYMYYVFTYVCVHMMYYSTCVEISGQIVWIKLPLSIMWVPGIELRSPCCYQMPLPAEPSLLPDSNFSAKFGQ